MKRTIRSLLVLTALTGMIVHAAGCDPDLRLGECTSNDDFPDSHGNYQGAICVDGHAQCADGSEACDYLAIDANGKKKYVVGCNPSECISCPADRLLCPHQQDPQGNDYIWVTCVEQPEDCWY